MGQAGLISTTHRFFLHSTLNTTVHFNGLDGTAYTRLFSVWHNNKQVHSHVHVQMHGNGHGHGTDTGLDTYKDWTGTRKWTATLTLSIRPRSDIPQNKFCGVSDPGEQILNSMSQRIQNRIRKICKVLLWGPYGDDSWKKHRQIISWYCPFNGVILAGSDTRRNKILWGPADHNPTDSKQNSKVFSGVI
jgi:hypothetical protein